MKKILILILLLMSFNVFADCSDVDLICLKWADQNFIYEGYIRVSQLWSWSRLSCMPYECVNRNDHEAEICYNDQCNQKFMSCEGKCLATENYNQQDPYQSPLGTCMPWYNASGLYNK